MKTTRLEVRLRSEVKELIEHAAELRNQSTTQFVLSTLAVEAGKVVAEHERTVLSERDRDRFLKLLDKPPAPNQALRKAAERYGKQQGT